MLRVWLISLLGLLLASSAAAEAPKLAVVIDSPDRTVNVAHLRNELGNALGVEIVPLVGAREAGGTLIVAFETTGATLVYRTRNGVEGTVHIDVERRARRESGWLIAAAARLIASTEVAPRDPYNEGRSELASLALPSEVLDPFSDVPAARSISPAAEVLDPWGRGVLESPGGGARLDAPYPGSTRRR